MDLNVSADEVLSQISQLHNSGQSLAKKYVKKQHPDLMKRRLVLLSELGTRAK